MFLVEQCVEQMRGTFECSTHCFGFSVAEVAHAGEDHGYAEAVGGGDDVRVFD
jgi:hypothetical protein